MSYTPGERRFRPYILVVEDDVLIASDLAKGLEALGYTSCGLAASGKEATAMAATLKPDLILMDIYLRGEMDGVEAARLIRRQTPIPVVFISGYADADLLNWVKSADPYGFVLKPFNIYEIRAAVEIALYRASLEGASIRGVSVQRQLLNDNRLSTVMTPHKTDRSCSGFSD